MALDYLVRGLPLVGKSVVRSIITDAVKGTVLSTDDVRKNIAFLDIFRKGQVFQQDPRTTLFKTMTYDVMRYAGTHRESGVNERIKAMMTEMKVELSADEQQQLSTYYDGKDLSKPLVFDGTFAPDQVLKFYSALRPKIVEIVAGEAHIMKMAIYRKHCDKNNDSQAEINIYVAARPYWVPCKDIQFEGKEVPAQVITNNYFAMTPQRLCALITKRDFETIHSATAMYLGDFKAHVQDVLELPRNL